MPNAPVSRTINIYIDPASAQKSLQTLQKQSDQLTASIQKGQAAGRDMTGEFARLDKVKADMAQLTAQINGSMAPSLRQVGTAVSQLYRDLKQMSADAPGYAEKFKQYQEARKTFDEMSSSIKGVKQSLSEMVTGGASFKEIVAGVFTGEAIMQGLEKLKEVVKDKIAENAKLSDSLVEMQDALRMTDDEVNALDAGLKKINTRTPTEQLRELAVTAGQLGVAKQDALGFVEAADKITVALGKKVGDPSQFIKDLVQQYKVFNNVQSITGEELLKTANAFQVASNQGAADAQFILGFAGKLQGVASAIHISQSEAYGLAAGLSEIGVKSDGTSAAIIKLLQQMGNDMPKYAKLAGISAQDFANMLRDKPVEALLAVTKGLASSKNGLADISEQFKDSQDGGARVANVLALIGQKGDILRESISKAGTAMGNTEAITEQFDKKNNDLAGTLDKIKKKMAEAFVSGAIGQGINNAVTWFGKLIGAIDKTDDALDRFNEQKEKVGQLKDIEPAIRTYDDLIGKANELGGKTKLSADEQARLQSAIKDIGFAIPSAITQFDKYGNALDISTEKAKQFLKVQSGILAALNKEAISSGFDQLHALQQTHANIMAQLNTRDKNNNIYRPGQPGGTNSFGISTATADEILSPEKIRQLESDAAKLEDQIQKLTDSLLQMSGVAVQAPSAIDAEIKHIDALIRQRDALAQNDEKGRKAMDEQIKQHQDYLKTLQQEADQSKKVEGNATIHYGKDAKAEQEAREKKNLLEQIAQANTDLLAAIQGDDQKELQSARDKYDKIIEAAKKYHLGTKELEENEQKYLETLRKKQADKNNEKQYDDDLKKLTDFYNEKKDATGKDYVAGLLTTKQYNAAMKQLEIQEGEDRLKISKDYSDKVKKAKDDADKQAAANTKEQVEKKEKEEKQRPEDAVSNAERAVATAPKGSRQELNAEKALLDAKFELEKAAADATDSMILAKQAELNKKKAALDKAYAKQQVEKWGQIANQGIELLGEFFKYQNQQEQSHIDKLETDTDKDKQRLQQQLDNKQISQAQYNKQVQADDQKVAKAKSDLAIKEFNQTKAMNLGKAIINEALAITAAWTAPESAVAMDIIIAAVDAVQIATIAAQKPPQSFGDGGILPSGPLHANGGMAVMAGSRKIAEIEGGEPVLSRSTYANNKPMVDALLNSKGKSLDWWNAMPAPINFSRIAQAISYNKVNGAAIPVSAPQSGTGATGGGNKPSSLPPEHIQAMRDFTEAINHMIKNGIPAYTYWNDLDRKNQQIALLRKESSIGGYRK